MTQDSVCDINGLSCTQKYYVSVFACVYGVGSIWQGGLFIVQVFGQEDKHILAELSFKMIIPASSHTFL